MREPEVRKVQLTGGATLTVSLPKEWARQVNLKPGDEVLVIPQIDNTLLIIPRKLLKPILLETTFKLDEPIENIEHLERILVSYYLAGYDILKLAFTERTLHLKKHVKELIRQKFTGVEIIEESRYVITLQNLVNVLEINVIDLILTIIKTILGMLEDLKTVIEKFDINLLQDLTERDREVDRFYWLVMRHLKKISLTKKLTRGIKDPRDILEYSFITKCLERIADNITEISVELLQHLKQKYEEIPSSIRELLIKLLNKNILLLDNIIGVLRNRSTNPQDSIKQLNIVIDVVKKDLVNETSNTLNQVYNLDLEASTISSLRIILYNMLRISEYISDIAEALLNLIIERTSEMQQMSQYLQISSE